MREGVKQALSTETGSRLYAQAVKTGPVRVVAYTREGGTTNMETGDMRIQQWSDLDPGEGGEPVAEVALMFSYELSHRDAVTPDVPPPREPCAVYDLGDAELAALAANEVLVELGGRSLKVARTEVAQASWSEIMKKNPESTFGGCGPDLPVASVSWFDAMRYANLLSRRMGLRPAYRVSGALRRWRVNPAADGFRLPTVEEWTLAVMGDGLQGVLCASGNVLDRSAARERPEIAGTVVLGGAGEFESLYAACDDGYARLSPVATFLSPSGLVYSGVGNAAEWVGLGDGSGAVATIGGSFSMADDWAGVSLPHRVSPTMRVGGLRLVRQGEGSD